jgi:hypothetical protein
VYKGSIPSVFGESEGAMMLISAIRISEEYVGTIHQKAGSLNVRLLIAILFDLIKYQLIYR